MKRACSVDVRCWVSIVSLVHRRSIIDFERPYEIRGEQGGDDKHMVSVSMTVVFRYTQISSIAIQILRPHTPQDITTSPHVSWLTIANNTHNLRSLLLQYSQKTWQQSGYHTIARIEYINGHAQRLVLLLLRCFVFIM